jgi:hypothetical protein
MLALLLSLALQLTDTTAYFFVSHDCPISNYYSQEIRRVCEGYGAQGLHCELVYVDPGLTDDAARKHAQEYAHGAYPKVVDRKHELVRSLHATVTPQVVVVRADKSVAYSGRIDNFYVALGRKRRVVTEHDLRDALDALVAGRPVEKPETNPVGCFIPSLSSYSQ